MPDNTQKQTSRIALYIPLLQWTPQYERSWLRFDLIAGLTVAALVIPKALGYAGIGRFAGQPDRRISESRKNELHRHQLLRNLKEVL